MSDPGFPSPAKPVAWTDPAKPVASTTPAATPASSTPAATRARVLDLLRSARRPVLTGHVLADGDALGSAVALWRGLRQLGGDPRLVVHEPFPRIFEFLEPPGAAIVAGTAAIAAGALEGADLAVVVDNNAWERLAHLEAPLKRSGLPVVCLDHHVADRPFSDLHVLDLGAAATGIMVFDLLRDLGVRLDCDIADAIYASIVNDTGWFRHSNTDVRTFRVCEALLAAGADPARVSFGIGHHDRPEGKRALARFLDTIDVFGGGRLAMGHVTLAALGAAGAGPEETEDFVNHLRTLEGVVLCAFLREEVDRVKLSLRSLRGVSARSVALRFGGGGHELAAGATHPGPLARAIEDVRAAMRAAIG